jgi:hypothetical protein
MTPNDLALGEEADFEAQNCQYSTKVDAWFNVQLTTSPAIEPNACYAFGIINTLRRILFFEIVGVAFDLF